MLAQLSSQFELASKSYAEAYEIMRDDDWFILQLQEELGELVQTWNKWTGRGLPKGKSRDELSRALADETADLLGHVLLFARQNNLDLAPAIERKWKFKPVC
ncbi:pyrophosphatase [Oryzifoliimicrobium ureilyticus]|uniref:pyrophosphatase n=1 Tax=Oryzifoliimicrobium ureilyticus TaxID=3113724 RepID=UPI00307669CF